VRWAHQEGAAAFASKGAYLRHGLRMIRDLIRIRHTHRGLSRKTVSGSANMRASASANNNAP
jgi:hypothetical protein